MYCPLCGYTGKTKRLMQGSFAMEVVLWLFFLVPGVIYSVWRLTTATQGCPECKNPRMISESSPRAQRELHDIGPTML